MTASVNGARPGRDGCRGRIRGSISAERGAVRRGEPDEKWRRGRKHMVGYVGIMGSQDGLDYLIDAANIISRDWCM